MSLELFTPPPERIRTCPVDRFTAFTVLRPISQTYKTVSSTDNATPRISLKEFEAFCGTSTSLPPPQIQHENADCSKPHHS
eukprot:21654_4